MPQHENEPRLFIYVCVYIRSDTNLYLKRYLGRSSREPRIGLFESLVGIRLALVHR